MESSLIFAPGFDQHQASPHAIRFACIGPDLVIDASESFPMQAPQAINMLGACSEHLYIGSLGDTPCEILIWPAATAMPDGLVKADFRRLWGRWTQPQLEVLSRARQLAVWLHQHRHCGVCGQQMRTRMDEPGRECPSCQHRSYPRISPVCIGLVLKGEELLLGRSPHFPPGIYSALAGFMEAGESAEQCLRREIMEEAGIAIDNIRWFGSQSWPYPHSLMLGFFADYAGGELRRQVSEIEDLRWFRKDALPLLPHASSIAFHMIQHVLRGDQAAA